MTTDTLDKDDMAADVSSKRLTDWDAVKDIETTFCTGTSMFRDGQNETMSLGEIADLVTARHDVRPDKTDEEYERARVRWVERKQRAKELGERFTSREPSRSNKDGAWISAAILDDDRPWSEQKPKEDAHAAARKNPGKNLRNENVSKVGLLAPIDLDGISEEQFQAILKRLDERGLAYGTYSSHNHRPPVFKTRIFLFADRELKAGTDMDREMVRTVRRMIGSDLCRGDDPSREDGLEDPARWNAAGLMYLPSHNGSPEAAAAAFNRFVPGSLLELGPYIVQAQNFLADERAGRFRARVETSSEGGSSSPPSDTIDERLAKRRTFRDSIRRGENIHKSMVSLATMLWFDGRREAEIKDELRDALEHCKDSVDARRWQERYDGIDKIVEDQRKFAHKSEAFEHLKAKREKEQAEREEQARAAHDREEQEKAALTAREALDAAIAALAPGQLLEAGEAAKALARVRLDAVSEAVLLEQIVSCVERKEDSSSARKKMQKLIEKTHKEERERADANARQAEKETADAKRARGAEESSRRAQAKANSAEEVESTRARLTARHCWIYDAGGFYDRQSGKIRPPKDVYNEVYSDLPILQNGKRADPKTVLLTNPETKFGRMAYRPGAPETFVDEHGVRCLNAYRPTTLKPVEGDASPMLDLVGRVFVGRPDEERHFLDTIAYKVQKPGAKVLHAMLIGSKPGCGKGTIAKALTAILGAENVAAPQNEEIQKGNMGCFESTCLVLVHEFKMSGDRRNSVARFKEPISEEQITITPKYLNCYKIDCIAQLLAFTNYPDEMHIEPDDRRWWLFKSAAEKMSNEDHEAYFGRLHDWLDYEDGCAKFYAWLLARDVSGYNPKMRAPMTPEKAACAANSVGEVTTRVQQFFEDRAAPFDRDLINLDDALDHLREARKLGKLSRPALANFLRDHGGAPLSENGSVDYSYISTDGVRGTGKARLWAIRAVDRWRAASADDIGAEYCAPRVGAAAFGAVR